jgi:hypothetical protein
MPFCLRQQKRASKTLLISIGGCASENKACMGGETEDKATIGEVAQTSANRGTTAFFGFRELRV